MRLRIETTAVHQDDCADQSLAGAKAVSEYPTKRDAAPCFATGTKLITLTGEKQVEEIAFGDKVLTADNGFKPVAWTGRRTMTSEDLSSYPQLRPIRISKGVFGNSRPLTISPQHGLIIRHNGTEQLVRAHQIADMFGPQAAAIFEKCQHTQRLQIPSPPDQTTVDQR
ncbi:Hint domain-containing protein [Cognatiyoonia sp.]|uniref:Hint domain-containing protein n=1 Tax=Cognatiyoonia sp. TaxID=2211652 RepID=UPI003F6A2C3E